MNRGAWCTTAHWGRRVRQGWATYTHFNYANKHWLTMLEENKYEAVLNFKEEPRLKRKHVIKNVYIYFPQVKFINCCYCQVCGREAKHLVEIPLTFRDTRVFLCCSFSFQMVQHSPRDCTSWSIPAIKSICAAFASHMHIFEPTWFKTLNWALWKHLHIWVCFFFASKSLQIVKEG